MGRFVVRAARPARSEGFHEMSRHRLILPQADAACGKIFFPDRRTADGHRIALEVWNRATGRVREGYGLAVHRCKRCGGFHVSLRPIDRIPTRPQPIAPAEAGHDERRWDDWGDEAPVVHRIALTETAWS
jgi:hypothetical protein